MNIKKSIRIIKLILSYGIIVFSICMSVFSLYVFYKALKFVGAI